MANRIVLNNISYHGAGAIKEIVPEIQRGGYKHIFVASDPDLIKFGVTAKVTDLLDEAGISYTVYSDIKPNPTIENVKNGVEAFKACGADAIVTIGGGSSMDTAKAIGIIIENPEFADVRSLEGVAPTVKHAVPTIAVPTTAGTADFRRCRLNPLVSPTPGAWDNDSCYKPSALYDPARDEWRIWYNGRANSAEYIGLAVMQGDFTEADFA